VTPLRALASDVALRSRTSMTVVSEAQLVQSCLGAGQHRRQQRPDHDADRNDGDRGRELPGRVCSDRERSNRGRHRDKGHDPAEKRAGTRRGQHQQVQESGGGERTHCRSERHLELAGTGSIVITAAGDLGGDWPHLPERAAPKRGHRVAVIANLVASVQSLPSPSSQLGATGLTSSATVSTSRTTNATRAATRAVASPARPQPFAVLLRRLDREGDTSVLDWNPRTALYCLAMATRRRSSASM
jgi:hypothetical protein